MLEVGRMPGGLVEDRTHFGAWCVTSSPLILGYDLRDGATTDPSQSPGWSVVAIQFSHPLGVETTKGDSKPLVLHVSPR